MDAGFGDDEAYNVYDQPWRKDRDMANSIYRPSANLDKDVYGDDLEKLIQNSNRQVLLLLLDKWVPPHWYCIDT